MRPFDVSYSEKPADDAHLLAAVRFSTTAPAQAHDPANILVRLQGDNVPDEIWQSPTPVQSGQTQGIAWRQNAEALVGYLPLNETGYRNLEELGRDAYQRILQLASKRG